MAASFGSFGFADLESERADPNDDRVLSLDSEPLVALQSSDSSVFACRLEFVDQTTVVRRRVESFPGVPSECEHVCGGGNEKLLVWGKHFLGVIRENDEVEFRADAATDDVASRVVFGSSSSSCPFESFSFHFSSSQDSLEGCFDDDVENSLRLTMDSDGLYVGEGNLAWRVEDPNRFYQIRCKVEYGDDGSVVFRFGDAFLEDLTFVNVLDDPILKSMWRDGSVVCLRESGRVDVLSSSKKQIVRLRGRVVDVAFEENVPLSALDYEDRHDTMYVLCADGSVSALCPFMLVGESSAPREVSVVLNNDDDCDFDAISLTVVAVPLESVADSDGCTALAVVRRGAVDFHALFEPVRRSVSERSLELLRGGGGGGATTAHVDSPFSNLGARMRAAAAAKERRIVSTVLPQDDSKKNLLSKFSKAYVASKRSKALLEKPIYSNPSATMAWTPKKAAKDVAAKSKKADVPWTSMTDETDERALLLASLDVENVSRIVPVGSTPGTFVAVASNVMHLVWIPLLDNDCDLPPGSQIARFLPKIRALDDSSGATTCVKYENDLLINSNDDGAIVRIDLSRDFVKLSGSREREEKFDDENAAAYEDQLYNDALQSYRGDVNLEVRTAHLSEAVGRFRSCVPKEIASLRVDVPTEDASLALAACEWLNQVHATLASTVMRSLDEGFRDVRAFKNSQESKLSIQNSQIESLRAELTELAQARRAMISRATDLQAIVEMLEEGTRDASVRATEVSATRPGDARLASLLSKANDSVSKLFLAKKRLEEAKNLEDKFSAELSEARPLFETHPELEKIQKKTDEILKNQILADLNSDVRRRVSIARTDSMKLKRQASASTALLQINGEVLDSGMLNNNDVRVWVDEKILGRAHQAAARRKLELDATRNEAPFWAYVNNNRVDFVILDKDQVEGFVEGKLDVTVVARGGGGASVSRVVVRRVHTSSSCVAVVKDKSELVQAVADIVSA